MARLVPFRDAVVNGMQTVVAERSGLLLVRRLVAWEPLRPFAPPIVVATVALQGQDFCRRALYTRGRVGAALVNNLVNYDLQALALAAVALGPGLDLARALWIVAATSVLALALGV